MLIRYVPHAYIPDYLALGWIVMIPGRTCNHDHYSVQMEWVCGCKPVEPKR
jgi:hypothetical protein